jgi:hypothetical protein
MADCYDSAFQWICCYSEKKKDSEAPHITPSSNGNSNISSGSDIANANGFENNPTGSSSTPSQEKKEGCTANLWDI